MSSRLDFKGAFLSNLFKAFDGRPVRILDLGSGTSKDFPALLRAFPEVHYTGVEFDQSRQDVARKLLHGLSNVTLLDGFGEGVAAGAPRSFDVTISLSVLEHVKSLRAFLTASVKATRPGGVIIHRYDLGHSLHSGLYEKTKVLLCTNFPAIMPARHFTCHPNRQIVIDALETAGAEVVGFFHSQSASLKAVMNNIDWENQGATELAQDIIALDRRAADYISSRVPQRKLEYLFPSITVLAARPVKGGCESPSLGDPKRLIERLMAASRG